MTKTTKIFLVRHGRSIWNGQKRISGQMDPPLSEEGQAQAEQIRDVLRRANITAVHTSTLRRTVHTASPTAAFHGLNINQHPELKEINFGILQGRFRDHRDPEAQNIWELREKNKDTFRIPGGETYAEVEDRVWNCINWITDVDGNLLIVGHRTTNRAILAHLMGWPRSKAVGLKLRSKYMYEIDLAREPRITTIRIAGGRRLEGYSE